jgi:hypothetical protein
VVASCGQGSNPRALGRPGESRLRELGRAEATIQEA